jgi:mitochondrial fission protein ELM1
VKKGVRARITAPWPDLVLCTGYASVPVARFIREQSKGRTRLVHVGNPRATIDDFDLQITTPQYPRGADNLLSLQFPIGNPARKAKPTDEELDWLNRFPHPRRLVAVGGPARHWQLDERQLKQAIRTLAGKQPRGSLIVATSPRTGKRMRHMLERLLTGPHQVVVQSFPDFSTLLSRCQEIHVTADSVSMISEAILSGRPVGLIPIRRSLAGIFSHWLWERPLDRATTPDLRNFWRMLADEELVGTVQLPVAAQVCDTVERAADAVRTVLAAGDVFEEERGRGANPHLGAARCSRGRQ